MHRVAQRVTLVGTLRSAPGPDRLVPVGRDVCRAFVSDRNGMPMTAPQQRAGGLDANARGILVLVAAVVVGFLLLLSTGGSGADSDAGSSSEPTVDVDLGDPDSDDEPDGTTPDETDVTTTTTDPDSGALQPGEISVVVLNGGGIAGAAASTTQTLADAGYQMGGAGNAAETPNVETTVVYFAEGFEAEATAVASVMGRPSDVVSALPDTPPGPGADSANVVVVLGQDIAPVGD